MGSKHQYFSLIFQWNLMTPLHQNYNNICGIILATTLVKSLLYKTNPLLPTLRLLQDQAWGWWVWNWVRDCGRPPQEVLDQPGRSINLHDCNNVYIIVESSYIKIFYSCLLLQRWFIYMVLYYAYMYRPSIIFVSLRYYTHLFYGATPNEFAMTSLLSY